jgi:hypothetical protein
MIALPASQKYTHPFGSCYKGLISQEKVMVLLDRLPT